MIDAAVKTVELHRGAIDSVRRLAEQYQISMDEVETIAEAQRMVEKHQQAFYLPR